MVRPPQARSVKTLEVILDAAEALIAREGSVRLTLDGVAAESGVSKGGVQHHFRSKEALITALVSRKLAMVRDGMDQEERALGDHRARIPLSMARNSARQWADEAGFPPALLVAAALNSESLGEVRAFMGAKLDRIRAETHNPDEALVLVFASLGLLLTRALGFSTLGDEDGRRLFETIERIAEKLD